MFIEIDVVEFTDNDIPYTTIMVNLRSIIHIQPIGKRHRDQYTAGREAAKEKQLLDPNIIVSPIEDLPNSGAVMYLLGGHQAPVYYTVTPYTDIKEAILKLQGNKIETA